ncbi:electron transfer flavoprotein subunit alpha/FixB family protein [Actinotalea subterranea]|uniref:electron transfer flavoprotein subunit alpha/FixB family protein n=1 Tax=Actinotalea subterranea TaxID=2607497 RepID=UPI0011EE9BDE|nr:electron transfer flavoprotein subunit alpha/FixB family protein [Actinotalea subterranea]
MIETAAAGSAPADAPVLVLVDHHDAGVRAPVLELLTVARGLGVVHAVWFGDGVEGALEQLGAYGVATVHQVTVGDGTAPLPPSAAEALAEVLVASGATTVLVSSTFENKEVAARLALVADAGLVVDASGVEREADGRVVTVQQAFASTWTVRAEVRAGRAVVALKANAAPAEPVEAPRTPHVLRHEVTLASDHGVRVVERTPRAASDRPELGEAQVVVVGGRGTEGDFSVVEELADALGGAVGATRVATDEGWIGHEAQIGQTGVTISPRLYIGAGVSGAVHHRGGMQASGTIVAVNNDPEAPIFEIADLGIVGDLFTVLPQATAEIRRLAAER